MLRKWSGEPDGGSDDWGGKELPELLRERKGTEVSPQPLFAYCALQVPIILIKKDDNTAPRYPSYLN